MLRQEIKSRLEILPLLLVAESLVCFLLSYSDFYAVIYPHWEGLTECSFLMCWVFYSLSENWGSIAKKSIVTLFALNTVNFLFKTNEKGESIYLDIKKSYTLFGNFEFNYYDSFMAVIFSFFTYLLIHDLCWKK